MLNCIVKLTDFVAEYLENEGVEVCFMVSGGAVLHLLDSIDRNSTIRIVCSQHEQFAATAADAFSRISKSKLGMCIATSGPGATNLVTGVSNAFFDSIPMICITGQVSTFRESPNNNLRQYGFQETNVIDIFKPITKYATKIDKPENIKYELGKALYLARSGRPGPVLIDLPDDLQRVDIDPKKLKTFEPQNSTTSNHKYMEELSSKVSKLVAKSKTPLIILGAGVRIAGCENSIKDFIEDLNVPFITTWGAKDLFPEEHHLNIGTFGICGSRHGNWAISESDLIIVLGARLNQMQVGSKIQEFASKSYKVLVDIDRFELEKFKKLGLKIDLALNLNLKEFIDETKLNKFTDSNWHDWLLKIKSEFPIISEHRRDMSQINAYQFIDLLSKKIEKNSIIITDAGGNLSWTMQSFNIKHSQRLISAWNHSPMGFSLPAAIGAAFADSRKSINCIIGDGGLMMCLQELGTISRHKLPINIFIFNNRGHGIQKQTINTWLDGNQIGVDHETGLFFPDFEFIAKSFRISYRRIESISEAESITFSDNQFPIIYDVMINPDQTIHPMLVFGGDITNLDKSVLKPVYSE